MKSIASLTKNLDHTKTKFLQKYGSAEKTVDPDFEEQREHLDGMIKQMNAIRNEIGKLDEAIKGVCGSLLDASESISSFFEESEDHKIKGATYRNSMLSVDQAVREYLERQKEVYFNVEEIMGRLNALKKKVQRRDIICLEYDKWKNEVSKLNSKTHKDHNKVYEAEKKLEEHEEQYNKINTETLEGIKQIYTNRYKEFGAEFKLLVSNTFNLWKSAAECYSPLNPANTSSFQFTTISQPNVRKSLDNKPLVFAPTAEDSPPPRPAPVPQVPTTLIPEEVTEIISSDEEEVRQEQVEVPSPQVAEIMKQNTLDAAEMLMIGKPPSRPPPTPKKDM